MIQVVNGVSYCKVGGRQNNQDYCYPLPGQAVSNSLLYIVCDGVGGNKGGDVASKTAVEGFVKNINQNVEVNDEQIADAFDAVLDAFNSAIEQNPMLQTMATTAVVLKLNTNSFIMAHCGDSRGYQLRNGNIVFKTKDHSLVNDLIDSGVITAEEAAQGRQSSKITRALQVQNIKTAVPSYYTSANVETGDVFMLCTDGVWDCVGDEELQSIVSGNTLENAARLIDEICSKEAKDNYTFILLSVTK